MASISDFMKIYQRDYDQYAIIEKQVETLCKKLLKAQNIKFAWQSRVKEPLSLETKLRNRSSKYENDVQNIDDIKDLVAGRILLTRWRDFGLVERILNENFHISERSQHPKEGQEAASRESRFRDYGGLHFYLTRRVPQDELYSQLVVEIQVMSLAMSSWSELEHDFSYKKLHGELTKDVLLVLEATKGLANSQEVLLQLFEDLLDSNIESPRLEQHCDNPDPSLIMADLIHEHRETIQTKLRSQIEDERRCLQTFRTSDYEKHKARNPDRVEGTCQWFLQHRHFSVWQESQESSLLWVSADPGCGESVLSKSLIDGELRSNHSRTTCYFFFKDDNADQKSVTTALSALLHQLFSQKNALLKHAIQQYNKNGPQISRLFDTQWNVLITAAADPEAGEVVCILDALDECQDREREGLIAVLNRFQCDFACKNKTKSSLKFLVTSRPYFHIERRFKDLTLKFPSTRLAGEDESKAISQEINLVIKEKVQKLGIDLELNSDGQSTLSKELFKIEHRTYLWLYLIFDVIENSLTHTSKGLREIIQKLPRNVDDAYNAILERSTDKSLAKKLLHIVVSAVKPLTLREMNVALIIQESDTSYEDLDLEPEKSFKVKVKNLCGLFVSVVDSRIYLLHQTAKDFLISENGRVEAPNRAEIGNWKYSLEFRESNSILARACVFYLLFDVFEIDPFFIGYEGRYKSSHFTNDRFDKRKYVYTNKHYLLQYAASHWAFHVREAKVKDEDLQKQIISKLCNIRSGRFKTWYTIYSWQTYSYGDFLKSTTELMIASYFDLESTMLLLLKEGASVDATDKGESTALHYAAEFGGNERCNCY